MGNNEFLTNISDIQEPPLTEDVSVKKTKNHIVSLQGEIIESSTINNDILSKSSDIIEFPSAKEVRSKNKRNRGGHKDSVGGVNICHFFPPPPLEKYHDVYQIIGFNWVWFAFSTHFWDLQTQSNKGFITYLSAFTLFYILHYSHSFYINY